jgi:hypothetical protein
MCFASYQLRAGLALAHPDQKGVHDAGEDFRAFFIGQMAGAWQEFKLHSIKATAQALGRIERDGAVPVAPQQKCLDVAYVLERSL